MNDLISRQAAIDAVLQRFDALKGLNFGTRTFRDGLADGYARIMSDLKALPPVQPEITGVQAIEHLQKSGWMKNHDKQMYEMGLRKQLADDSDSYDALLPSAKSNLQPTCNQLATDCISRQATIDALHTQFRDGFDGDKWWNSTYVLAAIEGVPSAGSRWMEISFPEPYKGGVESHYCPNCGAEMQKGEA